MADVKLKIDDAPWRELRRKVIEMAARGRSVRAGLLAANGATSDLVLIGAVHEFGSPSRHIPERSWLRSTFRNRRTELTAISTKVAKGILSGKLDVDRGLAILGEWMVAEIKRTISQTRIPPPLQPATIKAKGSDHPLVDTGQLLSSITSLVI